jgi:hypothetical protein
MLEKTELIGRPLESADDLPRILPDLKLHFGETAWVMAELGFCGNVSSRTFYEYLKGLRKLGIPFDRNMRGELDTYAYHHAMEIALVLALRVYHVVPDALLKEVVRWRPALHRHYRRAYAERERGGGQGIMVRLPGKDSVQVRGMFVDLRVDFSGGQLVTFGPPQLLAPAAALKVFCTRDLAARALLPINLSLLAERVVALSLRAETLKRGD